MPPKQDVTKPKECSKCKIVKEPKEFSRCNSQPDGRYCLRPACKACDNIARTAKKVAKSASIEVEQAPKGTKETVQDFLDRTWTIQEGKKADPNTRHMKYVKLADISPAFAESYGPIKYQIAKVVDEDLRIARATTAGDFAFVSVPWCLEKLGVKECTKCPKDDNIRPLASFSPANEGGLRGDCKACEKGVKIAKYAETTNARDEKAAAGETRKCVGPCGEVKCVSKFQENRVLCISCRNKDHQKRGEDAVLTSPDKYRMCVGCQCAHKIEDFTGNSAVCNKRHASIAAQLRNSKKSACQRGKEWKLSDAEATAIFSLPCFYSKIYEPEVHPSGIDRLDNAVGYVVGNCVPCHRVVNMMKGDMTIGEFHAALTDIVERDGDATLLKARYDNAFKMNMTCKLGFEELCAAILGNTAWVVA
jgi:hypothetical protein